MIRLHYLQHVSFEGLDKIADWAQKKSYIQLTKTKLFEQELLPNIEDFDFLIIVGGDMNIAEEEKYPWLKEEKKFILKAIEANKAIIGICLGAQLIAHCLKAEVTFNTHKEIGWYPIKKIQDHFLICTLPEEIIALHIHSDSFQIPENAQLLITSEGCENQAFVYGDRILALQFHLEISQERVKEILEYSDFSEGGLYIQNKVFILQKNEPFDYIHKQLYLLLDNFVSKVFKIENL